MLLILIFSVLAFCTSVYFYMFYPQQLMKSGQPIEITTPDFEKYKNDCLHPCIRFIPEGFAGYHWWMIQSPYYNRNSSIENPLLYFSADNDIPKNWQFSAIVTDTPDSGFNSDPTIFYENNLLWIFWREKDTPRCTELNAIAATLGVFTKDGKEFSKPQVFLTETNNRTDKELCPILIKKNGKYCFYTSYYQFKPVRRNLGIAVWEGTSLEHPDFRLKKTIKIKPQYTCDKLKQFKLKNRFLFIPKPLKHDIWHFDLFESNNQLYMLSVAEWGENIVLSVAKDYLTFKAFKKPLLNSHSNENHIGTRQYFYKPTGFIKDKNLHLYYTTNHKGDKMQNVLHYTSHKLKV